jgi:hypothetical protein
MKSLLKLLRDGFSGLGWTEWALVVCIAAMLPWVSGYLDGSVIVRMHAADKMMASYVQAHKER